MSQSGDSRPFWNGGRAGRFFRGLMIRIAVSVALLVGGFVAIVLYLAFLATSFAWYQNLAVVLSIVVVIPACVVLLWVLWGLRFRRRMWQWSEGWDRDE